jgi:hypothetical protein
MILSSAMMLRHLGLDYHANQISNAVYNVIKGGRVKTKDMGGHNSTTGVLPTFVPKVELTASQISPLPSPARWASKRPVDRLPCTVRQ